MAVLAGEPWHLRPWEVGKLTPYQVFACYFHERHEDGRLKRELVPGASYEERFRQVWRRRGLPEWRVTELWRNHLARQDGKRRGKS